MPAILSILTLVFFFANPDTSYNAAAFITLTQSVVILFLFGARSRGSGLDQLPVADRTTFFTASDTFSIHLITLRAYPVTLFFNLDVSRRLGASRTKSSASELKPSHAEGVRVTRLTNVMSAGEVAPLENIHLGSMGPAAVRASHAARRARRADWVA